MTAERDQATVAAQPSDEGGDVVHFRVMQLEDIPGVMAIERRAYEFPWTDGIFRDCIRAGYYCRLCLRGTGLSGYGIMAVAAGEAHVLNLCVDRIERGRGLGKVLLTHLIGRAEEEGALRVLLEVRVSNSAALSLYESAGFEEIGLRRNYYPGRNGRENAIVLSKTLAGI